jgi:hypothetical protein
MADAAYKIYLKNGSVMKGISHYTKAEGEVRFYFGGGIIGIPETEILKIESSDEPARDITVTEKPSMERPEPIKAAQPDIVEKPKETPVQEDKSTKINEAIAKKEAELKKVEEEYKKTMIRIQSLYLKSSKGTITDDERSMLQQNMAKKRKIEDEKKTLEEELKKLKDEKGN